MRDATGYPLRTTRCGFSTSGLTWLPWIVAKRKIDLYRTGDQVPLHPGRNFLETRVPWTSKIMHFGGISKVFAVEGRCPLLAVRTCEHPGHECACEPERRRERRAGAPQAPRDAQTCPGCCQCCPYRFAGRLEHPTDPNRRFSKKATFLKK